jgi:hypothetical protein
MLEITATKAPTRRIDRIAIVGNCSEINILSLVFSLIIRNIAISRDKNIANFSGQG